MLHENFRSPSVALFLDKINQNICSNFQNQQYVDPVEVSVTSSSTRQVSPLKRVQTITRSESQSRDGVLIECVKPEARQGKLLVKAISSVKNSKFHK